MEKKTQFGSYYFCISYHYHKKSLVFIFLIYLQISYLYKNQDKIFSYKSMVVQQSIQCLGQLKYYGIVCPKIWKWLYTTNDLSTGFLQSFILHAPLFPVLVIFMLYSMESQVSYT